MDKISALLEEFPYVSVVSSNYHSYFFFTGHRIPRMHLSRQNAHSQRPNPLPVLICQEKHRQHKDNLAGNHARGRNGPHAPACEHLAVQLRLQRRCRAEGGQLVRLAS